MRSHLSLPVLQTSVARSPGRSRTRRCAPSLSRTRASVPQSRYGMRVRRTGQRMLTPTGSGERLVSGERPRIRPRSSNPACRVGDEIWATRTSSSDGSRRVLQVN